MHRILICTILLLSGVGKAAGLTVKPAGVRVGTIPEIEASAMSNEPVFLTISLGNFMSGEAPTILSWQLLLSLVPGDGAVGAMTVKSASPIQPSLLGEEAFFWTHGLGMSSLLIQELDPDGIGGTIEENQERDITAIELSHSPDANGTFILSLLPFVLDDIDGSPSWLALTDSGFEIRPFANSAAASGIIELVRFTVRGSSVEGDFNGDLVVDAADYTVWRNKLGTPGFTLEQYAVWKDHFGESASGATGDALPEPDGWLMFALSGVNILRNRHRLRR